MGITLFIIGAIALAILLLIKNDITLRNMVKINLAIHEYNIDVIFERVSGDMIDYDEMMGYLKVLFRFWDWGYKNILPKDKYELIKDYIQ